MSIINRFEKSCGTFKGGGGKNPCGLVCLKKRGGEGRYYIFCKNNNDHGVGVSIVMVT